MIFREFFFGSDDYLAEIELRDVVLRRPLGLTLTEADRAEDPFSFHLGAFLQGRLVAVLLLAKRDEKTLKMRQVAVASDARKCGIGSGLLRFAEEFSQERGYEKIVSHARETAIPFYEKLEYDVSGEVFYEIGLPHRMVTKTLAPAF